MATIPREAVDCLTSQINALSADAQSKVLKVLEAINWTPGNIAECRDIVIAAVQMVVPQYTTLAAQASADFYDAARVLSVGEALGAQVISGYEPEKTDGAIRAFVNYIVDGSRVQTFNDQVLQRIDYEMKLSANTCIVENGRSDSASVKYARVPTGAETCDFCLMLASRGFVYQSESTATASHVHSACDCRIIPGWKGDTVEDYDPSDIYDRWQNRIDELAAERAERKGTTESEERSAIMRGYGNAAKLAKQRKRTA